MQLLNYPSLISDASLVGYYRFEGNSNATVIGPNGTDSNMTYATGKYGQAAVFNDVNGQINLGSTINLGSGSWSVCCWVKRTNAPGDHSIVGQGDGGSPGSQVVFTGLSTNDKMSVRFSTYDWEAALGTFPGDNIFHHYVFTYNTSDNAMKLYRDGALLDSTTMAGDPSYSGKNLTVGALRNQNFMDGQIDDLGFFTRVLTAAEILRLYQETAFVSSD